MDGNPGNLCKKPYPDQTGLYSRGDETAKAVFTLECRGSQLSLRPAAGAGPCSLLLHEAVLHENTSSTKNFRANNFHTEYPHEIPSFTKIRADTVNPEINKGYRIRNNANKLSVLTVQGATGFENSPGIVFRVSCRTFLQIRSERERVCEEAIIMQL